MTRCPAAAHGSGYWEQEAAGCTSHGSSGGGHAWPKLPEMKPGCRQEWGNWSLLQIKKHISSPRPAAPSRPHSGWNCWAPGRPQAVVLASSRAGRRGREGSETPRNLPGQPGKATERFLEVLLSSTLSAAWELLSAPRSGPRTHPVCQQCLRMPCPCLTWPRLVYPLPWPVRGGKRLLSPPRVGERAQPDLKALFGYLLEVSRMRL